MKEAFYISIFLLKVSFYAFISYIRLTLQFLFSPKYFYQLT